MCDFYLTVYYYRQIDIDITMCLFDTYSVYFQSFMNPKIFVGKLVIFGIKATTENSGKYQLENSRKRSRTCDPKIYKKFLFHTFLLFLFIS